MERYAAGSEGTTAEHLDDTIFYFGSAVYVKDKLQMLFEQLNKLESTPDAEKRNLAEQIAANYAKEISTVLAQD